MQFRTLITGFLLFLAISSIRRATTNYLTTKNTFSLKQKSTSKTTETTFKINHTGSANLTLKFNSKSNIMDLSSIAKNHAMVKNVLEKLEKVVFQNSAEQHRKFPQLVTGLSKNHLAELKPHLLKFITFIESPEFSKYYDKPEKIVIWNLDRNDIDAFKKTSHELTATVNNRITLDFRQFEFEDFPPHVGNLGNFAWKIIINTMMLVEFGSIWWFDSSIMPLNNKLMFKSVNRTGNIEKQKTISKYEILANMTRLQVHSRKACYLFTAAGSNTDYPSFTCPKMHVFLNYTDELWNAETNKKSTVKGWASKESADMQQAGAVIQNILYDEERRCRNGIFKPMFFCALIQECVSPPGAEAKARKRKHCRHRFDQSVANLVVNEFYGYAGA